MSESTQNCPPGTNSRVENSDSARPKQHHPEFYMQDGSVILELSVQPGILYRLHASILAKCSAAFEGMFLLPQGDTSPERTEGKTDSHPINLPLPLNTTALDFDHLLDYIYNGATEHPQTDEFRVSVLQLSTFFELDDGIKYAIKEFEGMGKKFDPALQFQLARMFRVDK
ncbi:hypothetical protein B0H16DRAFT_1431434 [Mycena metata]|uniref:BTB domain-containing protein n=1 Tax=Mycena metata TaxID=1033252 RepID=A0AAD7HJS0_9AGAR|nr:hypothetical protein B0H16DRAFT_1431434 [Mycena metata]